MKKAIAIVLIIIANVCVLRAFENPGINLFGYMQSTYLYQDMDNRLTVFDFENEIVHDSSYSFDRSTFMMQQFDLMLSKTFSQDDHFRVFVDLEFKLNYSSERGWGALNLQEAWLQYKHNDQLNVQFGKLFPKFNHLNEIKNKLPLMKYIFRPTIYEQILSEEFDQEDIIPEYGFLQLTGFIPIIGNVRFEYAAYVGNSESSYISNDDALSNYEDFISGVDIRQFGAKLIGSRIGLYKSDETFKAGISFTYDKDNRWEPIYVNNDIKIRPAVGGIPRYRLGFDFVVNDVWGFDFLAEVINVFYDYDKTRYPKLEMGQMYLLSNISYNIWDELYAYGMYEYMQDEFRFTENSTYSMGLYYKINDFVSAKAQYVFFEGKMEAFKHHFINENKIDFLLAGVSVVF